MIPGSVIGQGEAVSPRVSERTRCLRGRPCGTRVSGAEAEEFFPVDQAVLEDQEADMAQVEESRQKADPGRLEEDGRRRCSG